MKTRRKALDPVSKFFANPFWGWLFGCVIALAALKSCFDTNLPEAQPEEFQATYSFANSPFVHPRIVEDLIGWFSDSGEQVISINMLDSQNSNRYSGEVMISVDEDPLQSPLVYSIREELLGSRTLESRYSYRYIGSTPDGLDVIHYWSFEGGILVPHWILFARMEADRGVEYQIAGRQDAAQPKIRRRELIRLVGKFYLGNKWAGTIHLQEENLIVFGHNNLERLDGKPPETRIYRLPNAIHDH